jgi:hypothetical protein
MPDSINKTGTYVATFDHYNGDLSKLMIWAFYKHQNKFVNNNIKMQVLRCYYTSSIPSKR